ncbi:hypothetical protein BJX99DRAFT_239852 [Aspergillus californicus]
MAVQSVYNHCVIEILILYGINLHYILCISYGQSFNGSMNLFMLAGQINDSLSWCFVT